GEARPRRQGPVRRWHQRYGRLLHRAHRPRSPGPGVSHDVRGDLRTGPVGPRLPRGPLGRDVAPRGPDLAVCAHRRDFRAGQARGRGGKGDAAVCRRELLHQRQAHRCGRGAAAVRRRARQRHERQGGEPAQPDPLGEPPRREGKLRPAAELQLPVHGRGVSTGGARPPILVLVMGGAFALLIASLVIGSLTTPEFPPYTTTQSPPTVVGDSLVGPATYTLD